MAAPTGPPPTTYAFIPAPPLPEFYLPKQAKDNNNNNTSSSSSIAAETTAHALAKTKTKGQVSKQCRVQTRNSDEAIAVSFKLPAAPGDATDETMLGFTNGIPRATREVFYKIPPPPLGFSGDDVPPLAVYHICRICIRPRSARYHREHPIPINGVPPPPGICRRCRVTRIVDEEIVAEPTVSRPKEKLKLVEVVTQGESNDIKIGVAAFAPAEDYVTREEMKHRRGQNLLREAERHLHGRQEESESMGKRRDVTYRYVRIRKTQKTVAPPPIQEEVAIPPPPPPQIPRTSNSTAQDAIDAVSVRSPSLTMTTAVAAATIVQVKPTQIPSSSSVQSVASAKLTEIVQSVSKHESNSASSSGWFSS